MRWEFAIHPTTNCRLAPDTGPPDERMPTRALIEWGFFTCLLRDSDRLRHGLERGRLSRGIVVADIDAPDRRNRSPHVCRLQAVLA